MNLSSSRNYLRVVLTGALCAGIATGGRAVADNSEPAGDEDVEQLRQDVATMKRTLGELLELERKRVEVLARGLENTSKAPVSSGRAKEVTPAEKQAPHRPPSLPPGKDDLTGVVAGQVKAPKTGVAVVFIEDINGRLVRGRTVAIKQENKQFSPRWAVVQVGTKLEFPNVDPVYHNVFSRSPGNTFDLGIYRGGDDPRSWVAMKPGVIDVFCNMHPNMSSSVLVVPNNFFTEVKPDGTFTLGDVPRGRHKIVAWAPNTAPVSAWVDIAPGKQITVAFELQEKDPGHLNKLGQSYGSYR